MDCWNFQNVVSLLLNAGKIALDQRGTVSRRFKGDKSLVTEADRNVEAFLHSHLAPANGNALFLGEESADAFSVKTLSDHGKVIWIVDPIDATANYAYGKSQWGISIGYAENGMICEGGVFLPQENALLVSDHGKTFFADTSGCPDPAEVLPLFRELQPLNEPFTDGDRVTFSQGAAKQIVFDGPNSFISSGCCLSCGIDIALGHAAVYVTGAKIWDFGGFLAPLRNIGCVSASRSGTNLICGAITQELYNLNDGAKKFAVQEINWIGKSPDAVAKTMRMCRNAV